MTAVCFFACFSVVRNNAEYAVTQGAGEGILCTLIRGNCRRAGEVHEALINSWQGDSCKEGACFATPCPVL